ncbi:MAG: hypothetical protein ACE5IY_03920 [bacterium]
MTEYGGTLGVPNAGRIEGVGERKIPNQGQQPKNKKKKKDEKRRLLVGDDQVLISAPPGKETGRLVKTRLQKETVVNEEKGTFVDVTA